MNNAEVFNPDLHVTRDRDALQMFALRVRAHRLNRNWSQLEMARRVGMARSRYQDFERGAGNLTLVKLLRVLGILGLTNSFAQMVPPVAAVQFEPAGDTLLARVRASRKKSARRDHA